jgi:hypothetical protein
MSEEGRYNSTCRKCSPDARRQLVSRYWTVGEVAIDRAVDGGGRVVEQAVDVIDDAVEHSIGDLLERAMLLSVGWNGRGASAGKAKDGQQRQLEVERRHVCEMSLLGWARSARERPMLRHSSCLEACR